MLLACVHVCMSVCARISYTKVNTIKNVGQISIFISLKQNRSHKTPQKPLRKSTQIKTAPDLVPFQAQRVPAPGYRLQCYGQAAVRFHVESSTLCALQQYFGVAKLGISVGEPAGQRRPEIRALCRQYWRLNRRSSAAHRNMDASIALR